MKKETMNKHNQLANNLMFYIYEYIDTNINIDELSIEFGISKFHFHRIFKEQMGMNIYEIIKSIRLQKASNLLITNKLSTITQIANMCGYNSQSSFIRAFKKRFAQTPTIWRLGGYKKYSNEILNNSQTDSFSSIDFSILNPKIIKTQAKRLYYIRQRGYKKESIIQTWQKLMAWVYTNHLKEYEQIGIYHDNPIITPLERCFYVASISQDLKDRVIKSSLPYFETKPDICASFEVVCKYDDILKLIQWVYHEWLPKSDYETTPNPSYIILEKNCFWESKENLKFIYNIPIRFI
ncbi:MAG: helix-turn-helix domain-containing protein [Epsilonproteobacteria bacterium]|nr:helix-turn-helix domain-containing protein [Campylobacterota bacterium]